MAKRALVLGGAGFLGSAITIEFVEAGWETAVLDSLHPAGFGDRARLSSVSGKIGFTSTDVAIPENLKDLFSGFDIVVNAIGLSRHSLGEGDPKLDLELNLKAHLPVFRGLAPDGPRFIHLGTLHQFGGAAGQVGDDDPFAPIDVQGIHKCAAEQHLRLHCRRSGAHAIVLRIGNCIGPDQPTGEGDVGLFGALLRDLAAGKTVEVFGGNRARNVCFTPDIGRLAVMMAATGWSDFLAVNVPGTLCQILDVARGMQHRLGCGAIAVSPMPEALAQREVNRVDFSGERLRQLAPQFEPTGLNDMLRATVPGLKP